MAESAKRMLIDMKILGSNLKDHEKFQRVNAGTQPSDEPGSTIARHKAGETNPTCGMVSVLVRVYGIQGHRRLEIYRLVSKTTLCG